jgi:hypothetical protein
MQRTLNSAEKTTQLLARINGTLPILGDEQKTERVAEIKHLQINGMVLNFE